jgi:hypothetical protein
VAGAAVLLQSFGQSRGDRYMPSKMRALLSDTETNTASSSPANDRIGVMPNLRGIIDAEIARDRFQLGRWKLVAKILFGVIGDGGGVVWIPGTGPVPIDPWGPLMIDRVSPDVRDILAALAVHELAALSWTRGGRAGRASPPSHGRSRAGRRRG